MAGKGKRMDYEVINLENWPRREYNEHYMKAVPCTYSFTASMLPWAGFEGFNLNTMGFEYLIPIFTMGRFYDERRRVLMPLAIQVHHAVCDGYHACAFIDDLQDRLNSM